MVVPPNGDTVSKITISEIQSTLIDIESFPVEFFEGSTTAFSPSTYQISISTPRTLRILDIRNSDCLLKERGNFHHSQFSSDGSLFAASMGDRIRVWEYTAGSYAFGGSSCPRPLSQISNFPQIHPKSCFGARMFSGCGVCTIHPPIPEIFTSTQLPPALVVVLQLPVGRKTPSQSSTYIHKPLPSSLARV